MEQVEASALTLGETVGVVSHNESPLKALVGGGLPTLSTDFGRMGRTMADLVLNKGDDHIVNPFHLIRAHSL